MLTFLAGLGITLAFLIAIFGAVIAFAGIIATIRVAINGGLGVFSKIIWILASLFIPGAAFVYFAFIDKNTFLKFTGWVCILAVIIAALTGGAALWAGVESIRENPDILIQSFPPVENHPKAGVPAQTPDDSSIGL